MLAALSHVDHVTRLGGIGDPEGDAQRGVRADLRRHDATGSLGGGARDARRASGRGARDADQTGDELAQARRQLRVTQSTTITSRGRGARPVGRRGTRRDRGRRSRRTNSLAPGQPRAFDRLQRPARPGCASRSVTRPTVCGSRAQSAEPPAPPFVVDEPRTWTDSGGVAVRPGRRPGVRRQFGLAGAGWCRRTSACGPSAPPGRSSNGPSAAMPSTVVRPGPESRQRATTASALGSARPRQGQQLARVRNGVGPSGPRIVPAAPKRGGPTRSAQPMPVRSADEVDVRAVPGPRTAAGGYPSRPRRRRRSRMRPATRLGCRSRHQGGDPGAWPGGQQLADVPRRSCCSSMTSTTPRPPPIADRPAALGPAPLLQLGQLAQ